MKADLKCFLGMHHYELRKEEPLYIAGTKVEIGKVYISRCANCGKIEYTRIRTIDREV